MSSPHTYILSISCQRGVLVHLGYIIKHHRLSSLNNKRVFLPVPETGKAKVKVPADSVCSEGLLLVPRLLSLCCVLTWSKGLGSSLGSLL